MGGPDQPQPALGRAVRQLREAQGITQEGLAQNAGITTGTVSLVERGRSNPAWGTIKAIAGSLGVSIADIATIAERLEH
jgi:transcriptional regulator with XRE-family HTH domain